MLPVKVKHGDHSVNTIIGPNSDVRGDLETGGFTRVDGNMRGDLDVKGRVVVGERARMRGNLTGTSVTIGGIVSGNVLADERLVVLSTGLVLGDVITRRIQADDGCVIHGRIIVCKDDASWNSAVSAYKDARGIKEALSSREVRSGRA